MRQSNPTTSAQELVVTRGLAHLDITMAMTSDLLSCRLLMHETWRSPVVLRLRLRYEKHDAVPSLLSSTAQALVVTRGLAPVHTYTLVMIACRWLICPWWPEALIGSRRLELLFFSNDTSPMRNTSYWPTADMHMHASCSQLATPSVAQGTTTPTLGPAWSPLSRARHGCPDAWPSIAGQPHHSG